MNIKNVSNHHLGYFFWGIPRTYFHHLFFWWLPNLAWFYGSAPNLQTHQRPKGATMSMRTLWWSAGFLVGGWVEPTLFEKYAQVKMGIFISSLPPKKSENERYLKSRPKKSLKVGMILLGNKWQKLCKVGWKRKKWVPNNSVISLQFTETPWCRQENSQRFWQIQDLESI